MSATIDLQLDPAVWDVISAQYDDPSDAVREIVVLELYRRHEISSGKAAELLGTTRVDFIRRASDAGIPFFDMDGSELDDEVRRAVSEA